MTGLDDFVANVARSGLLARSVVDEFRADVPDGPASEASVRLARVLVDRGALTPYQAKKLLGGVTKGFFLGGHRILRPLGKGGMGKVYLASRESNGERVAIKVLPPKKAMEPGNALARFRREMELSQRVRHPNLARTIEVGASEDGVHFMVMEYVTGDSLYNLVRSESGGPLRVADAARYFVQVLDGLAAAHAAGLIHRDLKPSNLMVTPEGDAKILDLGLARAEGDESPLTRPNVVIGTLDYASPEQLSDAAKADERSDLYSIGCTLYFTLAGRPPFEGGDVVNKIYKQRMEDPPPLEKITRGVPTAFAAIVRKLMNKNPVERYQTARELRHDLARWTDPEVVHAMLGNEAETARAFHPPPPELAEEELRFFPDESPSSPSVTIRDLGSSEPGAPVRRDSRPPSHGSLRVHSNADVFADSPMLGRGQSADDTKWIARFVAVSILLVAIAILLLTLLNY